MLFMPPSRATVVDSIVAGWSGEAGSQMAALVIGPQGFGKRTTVRAVIDAFGRTSSEPLTAIELDASRYGSSGEADLSETFRRLAGDMASIAKVGAEPIARLPWGQQAPAQLLNKALVSIIGPAIAGRFVLCVHNLDALVGARSGETLLNVLRNWSEAQYDPPLDRGYILATSSAPPQQHQADHSILNWPQFVLAPLDARDVTAQLTHEGRSSTSEHVENIVQQSGGLPLLLRFALDATPGQPASAVAAWLATAESSAAFREWTLPHTRVLASDPTMRSTIRAISANGSVDASLGKSAEDLVRRGFVLEPSDGRFVPAGEVIARWLRQIAA